MKFYLIVVLSTKAKIAVVVLPASFGREPHEKSELPGQNEIVFPKPQFLSLIAPSLIVTEVRLSSPWRRPRSLEPLSAIGQLNPPADNACFGAFYPPR